MTRGVAIVITATSPPHHPKHKAAACRHWWVLDRASVGTCATCHAVRDFGQFSMVTRFNAPKPTPKREGSHAKRGEG